MNDFIDEIFTNTDVGFDAELNNLTINSMNSKNDKFNLDREGNLVVNSITTKLSSSSGLTFDDIYPVGIYVEISDEKFDPNVSWQGTWVLDSKGQVSKDENQSEFLQLGKTGGEKAHNLTVNEMPKHTHILNVVRTTVMPLNETGYPSGYNNNNIGVGRTDEALEYSGNSQLHNNLQPYVVVNRWHRIA